MTDKCKCKGCELRGINPCPILRGCVENEVNANLLKSSKEAVAELVQAINTTIKRGMIPGSSLNTFRRLVKKYQRDDFTSGTKKVEIKSISKLIEKMK